MINECLNIDLRSCLAVRAVERLFSILNDESLTSDIVSLWGELSFVNVECSTFCSSSIWILFLFCVHLPSSPQSNRKTAMHIASRCLTLNPCHYTFVFLVICTSVCKCDISGINWCSFLHIKHSMNLEIIAFCFKVNVSSHNVFDHYSRMYANNKNFSENVQMGLVAHFARPRI